MTLVIPHAVNFTELYDKVAPIDDLLAEKIAEIANNYDLLRFVKDQLDFFYRNDLIDAAWFEQFEPSLLSDLHIYTSGNNNLLLNHNNFKAIVIDCHLSLDVIDCSAMIIAYGNAYIEARLMGKSATCIKLKGKSTAEVSASGYAVANIGTYGNSNLNIENHDNSLVMIVHRSTGALVSKGTSQLIINNN